MRRVDITRCHLMDKERGLVKIIVADISIPVLPGL